MYLFLTWLEFSVGAQWFNHGFNSTLRPKLWNPVSSEKRNGFLDIDPGLGDAPPTLPLYMNLPSSYVVKHLPQPIHPAKICISAWIYPGMGYELHFLTPPLLSDLYIFYAFFIRTQFKKKVDVHPSLGPALPTLRSHLYCCNYAVNPMGAEQIISWHNRKKKTLTLSVTIQPNVIHSKLCVICVRNMISRLKKICISKSIWKLRHFVDQQTRNEDPTLAVSIVMADKDIMPLKLYIVHMYTALTLKESSAVGDHS